MHFFEWSVWSVQACDLSKKCFTFYLLKEMTVYTWAPLYKNVELLRLLIIWIMLSRLFLWLLVVFLWKWPCWFMSFSSNVIKEKKKKQHIWCAKFAWNFNFTWDPLPSTVTVITKVNSLSKYNNNESYEFYLSPKCLTFKRNKLMHFWSRRHAVLLISVQGIVRLDDYVQLSVMNVINTDSGFRWLS